jgi:hypothetical protein
LNQQSGLNKNVLLYNPDMSYIVVNSQEMNRYSYALNNPLRYIDPEGNQVETMVLVGVVIIGGVAIYVCISYYLNQPSNKRELSKAVNIGLDNFKENCSSAFNTVKGWFTDAAAGDPNQNPFKSKRDELLSKVTNDPLRNAVDQLYKEGSQVGDGGTADAIRYELRTGQQVGGKWHLQKGWDYAIHLQDILNSQNLNPVERSIAEQLYNDLVSALESVY